MPIYEFECTVCGNKFDRLQKMSDPNPLCGELNDEKIPCLGDTKKLISACNHELKGTGWYKTDFK